MPEESLVKGDRVPLLELFEDLEEIMLTQLFVPSKVEDIKSEFSPHNRASFKEVSEHLQESFERKSYNRTEVSI